MPTFDVKAAHRETGKPDVLTIEAPTPEEAVTIANDRGWLVEDVREVPPVIVPPPRSATPESAAQPRKQALAWDGSAFLRIIGILAVVLAVVGLWFTNNHDTASLQILRGGRYLDHRFKSDNAVGATANALENTLPDKLTDLASEVKDEIRDLKLIAVAGFGLVLIAVSRRR